MATKLAKPKDQERNVGLDLAKAVAAFGIVVLHFVGPQAGSVNAAVYLLAAFSIPVFVMANGYFVLNRPGLTWGYAVRKACDLLLLALFLCLAFWGLFSVVGGDLGQWGILSWLHEFLASALQRGKDSMLWFLWMLAGLELVSPLVQRVSQKIGSLRLAIAGGGAVPLRGCCQLRERGPRWGLRSGRGATAHAGVDMVLLLLPRRCARRTTSRA
jgi:surface polysaccharide O-acyltransferase-like enzyme